VSAQPLPRAIAFDFDGTFYPAWRLNLCLAPAVLAGRRWHFISVMGQARRRIRSLQARGEWQPLPDFYTAQARLMAEISGADADFLKGLMESFVYRGYARCFRYIRPYRTVRPVLDALKERGCRLAVMSDFPAREKLRALGLDSYFECILRSEDTGFLKPASAPFKALSDALGLPPAQILYAGDKQDYDVDGACKAGMQGFLVTGAASWPRLLGLIDK
jgi:putative hydrolase of the HAD superfamily